MDRAAGYELDLEVLTKVMGGSVVNVDSTTAPFGVKLPGSKDFNPFGPEAGMASSGCAFSRLDAAAMRVVDEMVRRGWNPTLDRMPGSGVWAVAFHRDAGDTYLSANHADRRVAICLAALQAVAAATDSGKDTSASNADAHSMTAPEGPR